MLLQHNSLASDVQFLSKVIEWLADGQLQGLLDEFPSYETETTLVSLVGDLH